MTSNDFNPLSCHISSQTPEPPSKMTSQNYDLAPKPQENELPIESAHCCLKPNHLPVRTVLLVQNMVKNNVHSVGLKGALHS